MALAWAFGRELLGLPRVDANFLGTVLVLRSAFLVWSSTVCLPLGSGKSCPKPRTQAQRILTPFPGSKPGNFFLCTFSAMSSLNSFKVISFLSVAKITVRFKCFSFCATCTASTTLPRCRSCKELAGLVSCPAHRQVLLLPRFVSDLLGPISLSGSPSCNLPILFYTPFLLP